METAMAHYYCEAESAWDDADDKAREAIAKATG